MQNNNCAQNKLIVYVNNSMAFSYCGNEKFSVTSTGKVMIIELLTSFWSMGVTFLCELQAEEEIVKDDCRCGWKKPVCSN